MRLSSSIVNSIFDSNGISIPEVSGLIALGVFVVQFLIPLALPFILLSLIKEKDSVSTLPAVTWTTVGQFLHSSLWPNMLSADSASVTAVPTRIVVLTRFRTFLVILIAVAAIVTPIGLYESILASKTPTPSEFHYVQDPSPFGQLMPTRPDLAWTRICGGWVPVACPNSFSNVNTTYNETGMYADVDNYDTSVPKYVIDAFQSGLQGFSKSVSSIFDIQARYFAWEPGQPGGDPTAPNGGAAYPVTSFREVASLLLERKVMLVDGLVVDMENGGIGFRNHSAPPLRTYGSEWSEDILFIEPQSQCVDTNLTLDFIIPKGNESGFSAITDLVLTDRGGFANLIEDYPEWDRSDPQNKPELRLRAYKAAWLNNVITMAFLNVTNPKNTSDPTSKAFEYLNSTVGTTFPLTNSSSSSGMSSMSLDPYSLRASSLFGGYLPSDSFYVPEFNFSDSSNSSEDIGSSFPEPLYPNPFNISSKNFTAPTTLCAGTGGRDYANISNFAAQCGLFYGTPRPQNSSSVLYAPGTKFSVPMYSCISTTQALIKTVDFRFNGSDDLSGISVIGLADKTYPDESSQPLWGVEDTTAFLSDVKPLWGLVSSPDQGNITLSTLRKPSLYLPGYVGSSGIYGKGYSNLPGINFYAGALSNAYEILPGNSAADYTGESSLAMFNLWQNYTADPTNTAKIPNLIWTDWAANAVVGTRGAHDPQSETTTENKKGQSADSSKIRFPVINYHREIRYHLPYAIPAIILLACVVFILVGTLVACLGRSGLKKMKRFLTKTSPSRILTARLASTLSPQQGMDSKQSIRSAGDKEWRNTFGRKEITLSNQHGQQIVIHDNHYAERTEPLLRDDEMQVTPK